MAKIFMAREGAEPARGPAWRIESLTTCVAKLGLKKGDFLSELDKPPHFGNASLRPLVPTDPVAVVVKVEEEEAAAEKWPAGFYGLAMMPGEVRKIFGE